MLIQAEAPVLEEIPEIINIGDDRLIVFVDARKPRCFRCSFRCSMKGHMSEYNPRKEAQEDDEEESTTPAVSTSEATTPVEENSKEKEEGWFTVKNLKRKTTLTKHV